SMSRSMASSSVWWTARHPTRASRRSTLSPTTWPSSLPGMGPTTRNLSQRRITRSLHLPPSAALASLARGCHSPGRGRSMPLRLSVALLLVLFTPWGIGRAQDTAPVDTGALFKAARDDAGELIKKRDFAKAAERLDEA